jgi:hypothetical protein
MLRLAGMPLSEQRVLAIETDYDLAADMAHEIRRSSSILASAIP